LAHLFKQDPDVGKRCVLERIEQQLFSPRSGLVLAKAKLSPTFVALVKLMYAAG